MPTTRRFRFAPIVAALLLALPVFAEDARLFTLTDPRGDDHGDGNLVYPLRNDLKRGDLDLLSLTASRQAEGTWFEATFARPITPTNRRVIDAGGGTLDEIARSNFYTLNIDIYIDTDRVPGSGLTYTLPGRKAEIDPANAWEKAICLTPRPFDARQAVGRMIASYAWRDAKARGEKLDSIKKKQMLTDLNRDIDKMIFFPTRVRALGSRIGFLVPISFLGGWAKPEWSYVVAVSGADVLQKIDLGDLFNVGEEGPDSLFILGIAPGFTWSDRFGGGDEDNRNQSPLVDIVVPPGRKQEDVLKDKPVRLPGVVPKDVK
ncbi:MAG TPA: glucodextranase DOMON-like domain-containing protein [Thermoanaerobaculia bacterium]|nr:glucodextranase DOMON-like domain-containing protein [Thermoanaerobaculia bacterium]